jgi:hypothetical protein
MVNSNSVVAYQEEKLLGRIDKRCADIKAALAVLGNATEREIKDHLKLSDMNSVRPRVTEMIKSGDLILTAHRRDTATGKSVRVVSLTPAHVKDGNLFPVEVAQ